MGVGHIVKHGRHAAGHQKKLQRIQNQRHAARQSAHHAFGGRHDVGSNAQTHTQQQRTQGDRRPVNEHALPKRPGRAHAPDAVERAVNGEYQSQRRAQQHGKPGHTQFIGLASELVEVAQHLARNIVWHQAFYQPLLQHILKLGEHRKRGEYRQRDRNKGHQSNGGGKSEATGSQAQTVFPKPLAQGVDSLKPRDMGGVLKPTLETLKCLHAAMMPPT